jgi:cephalosporin hydroxylase
MPNRSLTPLALCLLAIPGLAQQSAPALHASHIDLGDAVYESLLLHGFSKSQGGWRWTSRTFGVSLNRPGGREAVYLVLDFGLPMELAQANPVISVTAQVNGTSLPAQKFVKSGRYQYVAMVPESALRIEPARVEFELDRAFRAPDGSERGFTALSVALQHTNSAAFDRQAEAARAREGFEYLLAKRAMLIPNDKQTEMVKLFHQVPVWGHMFFQNVQIEKNPLDLWMMQQIIYEVQPDFIIETGTWKGGSALYFAHTLNGMGLERSKVITVDIQDVHQIASAHPLWKKYVTAFTGSSTDPDIVGKIAQLAKGKKTLITLDSDHSMAHVLKEMNLYAPLVSSGSYLVVEDTYIDGVPTDPEFGPGPMAAVRRFLEEGGDKILEQDVTREAYIMTFNPGGWLRRK